MFYGYLLFTENTYFKFLSKISLTYSNFMGVVPSNNIYYSLELDVAEKALSPAVDGHE